MKLWKESEEAENRNTPRKESVTFTSTRSLLGRGDLGHQSNTLRGTRACLSYRLGTLNICGGKREVGGGWALGKIVGKEDWERCWTLAGRSLGLGRYACCYFNIQAVPAFSLFQCFLTFQQIDYFTYCLKWSESI
jgi:hypothetical protein